MIFVEIPNVVVEGEICEITDDLMLLREGMLHVGLEEEGVSIDVSWHPEHDLLGEYVVTAYSQSWEDQLGQMCTNDPEEIMTFIETIIRNVRGAT